MRVLYRVLALLVLGALALRFLRSDPPPAVAGAPLGRFHFVDVSAEAGLDVVNVSGDARRWYIPESNGNGAAWLDFEGDGDQDLFIGNGQRLRYLDDGARLEVERVATSRLYLNGGFLKFRDASIEAEVDRNDWVNAVAVGDVDNDGDPDLYLGCFGPDVLLRKEGNRFVEATEESGLTNDLWAAGAAFGDANRDGALDLYVANYCLFDLANPPLGGKRNVIEGVEVAWGPEAENKMGVNLGAPDVYFLNDGKGKFHEQTREAGFALEKALCSYGCVWSDVTDDGWPDLLVANDMQPANLFVNQGAGRFVDEALARGFAYDSEGKATSAMGMVVADVDGDLDLDVLRTNFDLEPNSLHLNDGQGRFTEKARAFGLVEPSLDKLGWDAAFFDADLDGDLDLLVANGHVYPQAEQIGMHGWLQPTQLYEGLPHRTYGTVWKDVTAEAGPGLAPLRSARGLALADADEDGDQDVLVVDIDERPRFLRNDTPRRGHWLGLALVGKYGNRDALGAKVTVRAGGKSWTREVRATSGLYSSHDRRLLIGLGEATRVDSVEIRWPGGNLQAETSVPIDSYHTITERVEETR
jgi:enediyne biosynthesis protein E4